MAEKIHIPPFKIQGIKSKLVPLIKSNFIYSKDTVWIEPFMGSGVVGLNIAPENAIFADLNPHIVNFYNQLKLGNITSYIVKEFLRENGEKLSEKGIEHYNYVRTRFNQFFDPLDFLFLNRSCFNGMVRFNKSNKYNVPYGHKPDRFSKAYITKIVNQVNYFEFMIKVNNWNFLCQSYEDTLKLAKEDDFIYCDPPYIGRHVDYYDSWNETDEQKLYNCLRLTQAKFMLSTWEGNRYRKNDYIEKIWTNCNKISKEHFYFIGGFEENRNSMIEALLMNY